MNVLYQISLSQEFKNIFFFIIMSPNHEKMFNWNASIWVDWPCIKNAIIGQKALSNNHFVLTYVLDKTELLQGHSIILLFLQCYGTKSFFKGSHYNLLSSEISQNISSTFNELQCVRDWKFRDYLVTLQKCKKAEWHDFRNNSIQL